MFWREHWGLVLVAILALPILSAVGFSLWIHRQPNVSLETAVLCWDVFIKLISALTVIASGAMLFGKYIDDRADATAIAAKQANRELALREAEFLRQKLLFDTQRHERKLKLLGEAKTIAAHLATTVQPDQAAITRFNELYQADLIGVETYHGPVEAAMVRFRRKLRQESAAPQESLEELSLELSAAVETELKESEESLLSQHHAITERLLSPK